jgi:hypothetical protein
MEDRHDQRHVGQVRAAAGVGVVRDHDVAGMQPVRAELLEGRLDGERQRAEEQRHAVALGDQLPARVDQP